ncbi:hypothetical protein PAXRUDRAFT_823235 [Paxillus rubicundulus Ve08.2h10]|uniref:Uncharacterized protein n=1 Tax=Paxillus rubicundulus Ve08.2h10 TaxID=930991 RepID=A0A0D0DKL0_9AGAM|nr:hypothetical protein PAXRUDRAFT_823235 [Paxillus rubicundulus Ve08.2h10]
MSSILQYELHLVSNHPFDNDTGILSIPNQHTVGGNCTLVADSRVVNDLWVFVVQSTTIAISTGLPVGPEKC